MFYSIIILPHPFLTPGPFSSHVLQPSHTAPRLWNDLGRLPPEFRTISLPPPPSLPITRCLHPAPLFVTPGGTFHSKVTCHLLKHSYPDPFHHSPSSSDRRSQVGRLGRLWYLCGARPALTPGATPMRSTGNSASTGVWIPCTSGPTVCDSITLSWPRFSPTSSTLHLGSCLHSLY